MRDFLRLFRAPWICCVLVCVSGSLAHAGAWTSNPHSLYLKFSYIGSSASDQFGFDGGVKPIVEGVTDYPFADRSLYLYAEYGLRDGLTAVASVPMKRVFVHDRLYRYRTTGIGDIGVGLRKRVFQNGPWVGSASLGASVPTGYPLAHQPPLGAGQVDLSTSFNLGRSFDPFPGYSTGSIGLRYRSPWFTSQGKANVTSSGGSSKPDYANELFYSLELGVAPVSAMWLRGGVSGLRSLRAEGSAFTITDIPTTQRYLKLGGGVSVLPVKHLELSFDVYDTPRGINTAKSLDAMLGMALKW